MKLITVLGARPQFIKAAIVSHEIGKMSEAREVLIHTGQHFDANMSDVFFLQLEMNRPDYNLGVNRGPHGEMTGRMLQAIEEILQHEKPDLVLVYGDTNSTLAGSLAAAKLNIPVAHVEAGLRSFNRKMPEEINRIVVDHLATWLMTPTETATRNLRAEGIADDLVFQVGDVMYDAALYYGSKAERQCQILSAHGLKDKSYILATVHRQENTDDPRRLKAILSALSELSRELPVVLPLHPRTHQRIKADDLRLDRGILLLPPLGYLDMVLLERSAAVIVTDSGGVQKEAYFQGVQCVTLRDETEWVELIELNWNRLAPPGRADIAATVRDAITQKGTHDRLYGNGDAAALITQTLLHALH